jgi:ABC-type transporter MlaC component
MAGRQQAAFAIALILSIGLSFAASAEPGQKVVQDLVMLFSAWSGEPEDLDIHREAAKYIDYAGMAERVLGKAHWGRLEPSQKREFVKVFGKLVENRYYPRWHKIFYKGRLSYLGETSANGDVLVKSALVVGNKEDIVFWRLHSRNGELAVISLSVNENDLLSKLNDRFQKRLEEHGFANLLSWLQDKVDEDSDDDVKPESSTASR